MISGITGTIGAGKGTVVEYLVAQKNFRHISARSIWTKELEKRGLPVDRDHMTALANELRAENGAAYFVELALQSVTEGEDVVIESIRTVGEVELLKKNQGVLLAVDADKEVRYERIHGRGSALDDVTYEAFLRHEEAEAQNDDPNKQNIMRVMEMADFSIANADSIENLQREANTFLSSIYD